MTCVCWFPSGIGPTCTAELNYIARKNYSVPSTEPYQANKRTRWAIGPARRPRTRGSWVKSHAHLPAAQIFVQYSQVWPWKERGCSATWQGPKRTASLDEMYAGGKRAAPM
ncbi:hypothetical protein OOU_Y34scaffold00737g2 [Pyricularia oryzae Y34]|uniref:Uncharacterized protein n=2 Tax=Pyricularia oryzae TaxID=318829 RepID=A0AA97PHQ7_PYRO3|nr:hypothetical protein OOU_Y34scaffold00737g2 [Pyricularia oryzae Y34]